MSKAIALVGVAALVGGAVLLIGHASHAATIANESSFVKGQRYNVVVQTTSTVDPGSLARLLSNKGFLMTAVPVQQNTDPTDPTFASIWTTQVMRTVDDAPFSTSTADFHFGQIALAS